jgi:hypothetical protein
MFLDFDEVWNSIIIVARKNSLVAPVRPKDNFSHEDLQVGFNINNKILLIPFVRVF